jgi:hypothetical protein
LKFSGMIVIVFFLSVIINSTAQSQALNSKIHNQYNSLRAMGMGNAFTAVADDYSLLFYNPAGFGFKESGEVQFSLIGAGLGNSIAQLAKDISDAEKSSTVEADKINAISAVMDKYYGSPFSARMQVAEMFWVRPNWGLALLPLDLSVDIGINKQVGPALDLDLKKDTTFAFGYGQKIDEEISVGGTIKAIHRGSVAQSIPVLELAANSDVLSSKRFNEGLNIDLDIGVMYKPRWFGTNDSRKPAQVTTKKEEAEAVGDAKTENLGLQVNENDSKIDGSATDADAKIDDTNIKKQIEKVAESDQVKYNTPLTLSAVARNVFGGNFAKTKFINKDATDAPEKNSFVIDLGSAYEVWSFAGQSLKTTLDARNLFHPANNTMTKGLHLGVEYDFSPSGWLKAQARAGLNQGYFTAGFSFLLGVLTIDAVTFGEEVGTSTTKVESRMYALKLGFGF